MKNYSREQLREHKCDTCRDEYCNIPCQILVIRTDIAALETKVDANRKLLEQIIKQLNPPSTRWENVDV
jgi:hypothetical protein